MDWIQIITQIGIPGAFCIALAWYVKFQTGNYRQDIKDMQEKYSEELREIRAEHKEETKQMTDALNNNTKVMQRIADKLDLKEEVL